MDKLIAIVDRNSLCILGETEELMALGDLEAKWRSFGWHTVAADGHDFDELRDAFDHIGKTDGKPLAIIADTVKGKGISLHGRPARMAQPDAVGRPNRDGAEGAGGRWISTWKSGHPSRRSSCATW